jgi:predicted alpha/beta-fold hydrolase
MQADNSDTRIERSRFRPAWWLQNRHMQTIFPSLPWAFPVRPRIRRESLELPDGDVTAVDWVEDEKRPPLDAPVLVILHGLESSSASPYARMLMSAATEQGWHCCVLHFRDCGDYRNRLPRRYHAGETQDIRYFLRVLPDLGYTGPIAASGYSLGGNVLLKYLGEAGASSPLVAAAAVCVPLDLYKCAEALNKGFSKIYQAYLLRYMKQAVARKFDPHTAAFDWRRAMAARTFAEFDDAVTAPLHGFKGMTDYYDRSSSGKYLATVEVATLIINAVDDPFMTPGVLPHRDRLSHRITLEIAEAGGHVGFIDGGTPWRPAFYLPRRLTAFIGARIEAADGRLRPRRPLSSTVEPDPGDPLQAP